MPNEGTLIVVGNIREARIREEAITEAEEPAENYFWNNEQWPGDEPCYEADRVFEWTECGCPMCCNCPGADWPLGYEP